MSNKFIENLLEETITANNQAGLSQLEERKLRKAIKKNDRLMQRNAVIFEENEPQFSKCLMYNPCPICDKCLNKASHLYQRCETCTIPICIHTYADRKKMIRRENFSFKPTNVWEKVIESCDDHSK